MVSRRTLNVLTFGLAVTLLAVLLLQSGMFAGPPDPPADDSYDRTTVTLRDENGTDLAAVSVRVADTDAKRYTGLSNTESLDFGEGMLFVHAEESRHAYVMRNMSFPLDIVFVAENGTVTTVHHAALEPGESGYDLTRYRGRGKYVLEVPRGYANATGLAVGDTVVVPEQYR